MAFNPVKSQKLSIGSTSVESDAALLASTVVRLLSSSDCFIEVGASPTATSSSMFLPVGTIEYFVISVGQKVAVISAGNTGDLFMTEGN